MELMYVYCIIFQIRMNRKVYSSWNIINNSFSFDSPAFCMLSYGDLAVWKIHENVKEIWSVDNFRIHKACNIPWVQTKQGKGKERIY